MAVRQVMSLAQFVAWQSTQETKYEYDRGRVVPHVVAMPGGTFPHNRIEMNLVQELGNAFEESPYQPYTSNQMVATQDEEVGYFPDALLIEGEPAKVRYGTHHALTNPAVVFEVTSRSTRNDDGGRKLEVYRSFPTMREVILIDADEAKVVRHFRTHTGWDQETVVGLGTTLTVLGMAIPLARVYRGVELGRPD